MPIFPPPPPITAKGPLYGGYRYYKSSEGKDFRTAQKEADGTVFMYTNKVDEILQGLEKPDGSEQFPAKTCADLKMCHSDIENGMTYFAFN